MAPELQVERRSVPVWILILLLLLIYWGMLYFDQHGGWFSKDIYPPYRSFAELERFQPPKGGDEEVIAYGKGLFSTTCAVCHMENGTGNPANGCPPLVGSEWLMTPGSSRIIRLISKGLTGPIEVKGQSYGTGTMLPIGDQMPGDEKEKAKNIAAIISYVRKTFGNGALPAVKPEKVEEIRGQIKDHTASYTAEELKRVPEDE
jgi:mono/diheme cytochrome c family protein